MITYRQEKIATILVDFHRLLQEHMKEMNWFERNGAKFNPNYTAYVTAQGNGHLELITARDDKKLVGYVVFNIFEPMRYQGTRIAKEDVYYVLPEYRRQGIATRLFAEIEQQLRSQNIGFMLATTKTYLDRSGLLEQSGYEFYEKLYGKKL